MNLVDQAKEEQLLEASVGFDNGPQVHGYYFDSRRWNGWINPWITRESIEIIQDWFNEQGPDDRIDLTWNSDGSLTLVEATWLREDPDGYEPVTITPDITPDGSTVYSYLTYGYCWSVSRLPEEGDEIQFYGDNAGEALVVCNDGFNITWTDGLANEWTLPVWKFMRMAWGYID